MGITITGTIGILAQAFDKDLKAAVDNPVILAASFAAFGASFGQGTGAVDSGTVKGNRTGRKGKETPETYL